MPSYLSYQKLVHYRIYNYQERKIILPYNCSVDYEFCILKNHYSLRYFWKIQKYAKVLYYLMPRKLSLLTSSVALPEEIAGSEQLPSVWYFSIH